jgi:hypothetical protein
MRSSDFIPSEFRSFYKSNKRKCLAQDHRQHYKIFSYIQQKYSPDAGLIPDFIQAINKIRGRLKNTIWKVSMTAYTIITLGRVPWIAADYITGDRRSKLFLNPSINGYVKQRLIIRIIFRPDIHWG